MEGDEWTCGNTYKPAQVNAARMADAGCKWWRNKGLRKSPSLRMLATLWPNEKSRSMAGLVEISDLPARHEEVLSVCFWRRATKGNVCTFRCTFAVRFVPFGAFCTSCKWLNGKVLGGPESP